MQEYTRFSIHGPLIGVAVWMRRHKIWDRVAEKVQIRQKAVRYPPVQKLLGVLVTILSGAGGLVEANTRVRGDEALYQAFGFTTFPDQSILSDTLNACTAESVATTRAAVTDIYRRHGRGARHKRRHGRLILDVDLTGLPCGRQAAGATKGYFSGAPGRRGRQLGRVVASAYDEIVVQRLYPGKQQLSQSFCELVEMAEQALGLHRHPQRRRMTLLRSDAGGGTEREINWALERGYQALTKLKNYQRTRKLMQSVATWYPDPKVPGRSVGWIEQPHAFARPTLQIAIQSQRAGKKPTRRVLVVSLSQVEVVSMLGATVRYPLDPAQVALAVAHLYDLRGGGAETHNRQDKQGLGLTKRNKKSFQAQEMLVLLAELAHNLIIWVARQLTDVDPHWQGWGILRLIRDVFHIPGCLQLDSRGQPQRLILSRAHPLSGPLLRPLRALVDNELVINLGQI
jgi:hypothetical protein